MKRLLRKGLCLALGLTPSLAPWHASAQDHLNFRAVAPRPAVATSTSGEIPISLSVPQPATATGDLVFRYRGKIQDEGGIIVPATATRTEGLRFAQKDVIQRPAPLPSGPPADFPPQPQMIGPPPSGSIITNPNVSGPNFSSSSPTIISNGSVVSDQMISSPGPVTGGSCACSSGFSLFDGFITDDQIGSACGTCCDWENRWVPFQHLHDIFGCACSTGCCDPRPGFWVRGEYLLWNASRQTLPPLVSRAPTSALLPLDSGQSTLLFGNEQVPYADLNGARIALGFWFPRHSDWGLDGSYFVMGNRNTSYSASSDGSFALGRPIIDNTPAVLVPDVGGSRIVANPRENLPNAEIVAFPNRGAINVNATTQFWGLDLNLRRKLCCGTGYWIDGLVGYRHFQLEDTVDITENIGPRTDQFASTTNTVVRDSFGTTNVFNGFQLGLEGEWRFRPRLTLGGSVKVAMGNVHQTLNIAGSTTLTNARFADGSFLGNGTQSGGLLAQNSNIGSYSVDRFAVLPEVGIKLGVDITKNWRFYAGYNVMFLSNVVRAADSIDLNVNRSQLPFAGYTPANAAVGTVVTPNGTHGVLAPNSPATPAVQFRTSEFWAQGVSLGLEYRY